MGLWKNILYYLDIYNISAFGIHNFKVFIFDFNCLNQAWIQLELLGGKLEQIYLHLLYSLYFPVSFVLKYIFLGREISHFPPPGSTPDPDSVF